MIRRCILTGAALASALVATMSGPGHEAYARHRRCCWNDNNGCCGGYAYSGRSYAYSTNYSTNYCCGANYSMACAPGSQYGTAPDGTYAPQSDGQAPPPPPAETAPAPAPGPSAARPYDRTYRDGGSFRNGERREAAPRAGTTAPAPAPEARERIQPNGSARPSPPPQPEPEPRNSGT